jgi:hypothetical protein
MVSAMEMVFVEYRQQYPLCRIPHHETFENVHRTLKETGSFPQASAEYEQRRHDEDDDMAAV